MPGLLPHLLAGTVLYFVGRYVFKTFFDGEHKRYERILLLFVCLFFSIIPDVFLGFYYLTGLSSFETLLPYHADFHLVITPVAILVFLLLIFFIDRKRTPTWLMGLSAILLHMIMDQFIPDYTFLI